MNYHPSILVVFLVLSFFGTTTGAQVQYASVMQEYSSSVGNKQFGPLQVLGKPDAMPQGGKSPCAWMSRLANSGKEYLEVSFDSLQVVRQVAVFENLNPGGVVAVSLIDEQGKTNRIYKGPAAATSEKSRVFRVFCSDDGRQYKGVRVDFDFSKFGGQKQIDAIAISDSEEPIQAEIHELKDLAWASGPENLGRKVNSAFSDVNPVISPDGRTLYFTRKDHPDNINGSDENDDIWYSEIDEKGNWGPATNMDEPLNNASNNFVESVTPDGNTLLLGNHYFRTSEEADGQELNGVSFAYRALDGWSFPRNIRIENYRNYDQYVNYFLSNDGRALLMGIEHDDTEGAADLYVSFLQADSSWSAPVNLGPVINSAGSEGTPFLAADGVSLYYTSDGFAGYGSSDMYMSKRLDNSWKNWSEPVNLGGRLNTAGWDAYFTLPASGEYAYFVSSENSLGATDVFRIRLPKQMKPEPVVLVSGRVLDAKSNAPLEATIRYERLPEGASAGLARSEPKDGQYRIVLPRGARFGFRAEAAGYFPVSAFINLDSLLDYQELSRDLSLVPMEVGQVVRLNNIFFDFGKATLQPESEPELRRVVEFMRANSGMRIEVDGHTDDVGADAANLQLSKERAASVIRFLIENGVEASRLFSEGYGETRPITGNDSEEGRSLNRRVEFKILKL
ncbi:MAG: OmpA family protein [Bacteroidota bacterium]